MFVRDINSLLSIGLVLVKYVSGLDDCVSQLLGVLGSVSHFEFPFHDKLVQNRRIMNGWFLIFALGVLANWFLNEPSWVDHLYYLPNLLDLFSDIIIEIAA